jgi:hypothetical protein
MATLDHLRRRRRRRPCRRWPRHHGRRRHLVGVLLDLDRRTWNIATGSTAGYRIKETLGTISVSGTIPVTFADYGIDNPSGGPATTSDSGSLEFLLNVTHA